MESFREFKNRVIKPQVNYTSPWYSRKIIRKFSYYITWMFVKYSNITANQVTFFQFVVSVLGLGFLCFSSVKYAVLGVILLHVGYVFDVVDGEVARYRKKSSINGMFLDFVNHEVIIPMTFGCLAFHYFFNTEDLVFFIIGIIIIVIRNNPIGKARHTTINFLVEKRKSPTYDIRSYLNKTTEDLSSDPEINIDGNNKIGRLKKIRVLIRSYLEYPNDIIIVFILLFCESIFGNIIVGEIFLYFFSIYLIVNFATDLFWHMKKRVVERDFEKYLTACSEIYNSIDQEEK